MGNEYKPYNYGSEEVPDPQVTEEFEQEHEEIKKKKRTTKLTLILAVVVLFGGCQISNLVNGKIADNLLEKYLEQKYGEDFVIGRSEKYCGALGDPMQRVTYYKLKDNKELEFWASCISPPDLEDTEDKKAYDEGRYYGDNYLDVMWDIEYRKDMEPLMKEWFGDDVIFETGYNSGGEFHYQHFGRTPSYKEFSGENKPLISQIGRESYSSVKIKIILFTNKGEVNGGELEKALELVKSVQSIKSEYVYVGFHFYDENDKKIIEEKIIAEKGDVEKVLSEGYERKFKQYKTSEKAYLKNLVAILDIDGLNRIKTYEDLKQFIIE